MADLVQSLTSLARRVLRLEGTVSLMVRRGVVIGITGGTASVRVQNREGSPVVLSGVVIPGNLIPRADDQVLVLTGGGGVSYLAGILSQVSSLQALTVYNRSDHSSNPSRITLPSNYTSYPFVTITALDNTDSDWSWSSTFATAFLASISIVRLGLDTATGVRWDRSSRQISRDSISRVRVVILHG